MAHRLFAGGSVLLGQGRHSEAATMFEKALEYRPKWDMASDSLKLALSGGPATTQALEAASITEGYASTGDGPRLEYIVRLIGEHRYSDAYRQIELLCDRNLQPWASSLVVRVASSVEAAAKGGIDASSMK